jgi:predicted flap endonuclease-1-like 5' DNA nuclease
MNNIQSILQSTQHAGKTFVHNNRTILEPIGIAAGIATAVVASIVIGQGLLFSKGTATVAGAVALGGAKSTLPIKAITAGSATTAKTVGAAKVVGAAKAAAPATAAVQGAVQSGAAANQALTTSTLATPVSKVTTGLLNSVAKNASPLLVGAAGGGAAGWVGTQQIRQAEARLREQEEGLWQELSGKLAKERPEAKRKEEAGEGEIKPPSAQPAQGAAQPAATAQGTKQLRNPEVRPATPKAEHPVVKAAEPAQLEPERLEIIKGIGPIYEQLLNAAGITTFAQLAAQTPKQVHQIIAAEENSHMANVESWLEQAQQLDDSGSS